MILKKIIPVLLCACIIFSTNALAQDVAYVKTVVPNRIDQYGENHVTLSPYTFIRGCFDRFAPNLSYDEENSCLDNIREGLWAKVVLDNPTSSQITADLKCNVKWPDGSMHISQVSVSVDRNSEKKIYWVNPGTVPESYLVP